MGFVGFLLKTVAVLVGLLAITIGTIGKAKPELFFKVPNVGFILWAITGHFVPPYFDNTAYINGNFRTWVKDGDLIVATGAKSGTTWMCYCSHAIRTKGSGPLEFTDMMYTTPWMEQTQKPGMTFQETIAGYNNAVLPDGKKLKDYWDNPAYPFRIFKSHFGPVSPDSNGYADVLPVKEYPKVKYIALVRDFNSMAASVYSFFPRHSEAFRKLWGGFPPIYPDADAAAKDLLKGGNIYSLYFEYVKSWWPLRNEPNVFLYHYKDAVKDLDGLVTKLAKFLDVSLAPGEFQKVKEQCSFNWMKTHKEWFDYRQPLHPPEEAGFSTIMKPGGFISKESVDTDRSKDLSAALQKELTTAIESEFGFDPKLKEWSQKGGSFK